MTTLDPGVAAVCARPTTVAPRACVDRRHHRHLPARSARSTPRCAPRSSASRSTLSHRSARLRAPRRVVRSHGRQSVAPRAVIRMTGACMNWEPLLEQPGFTLRRCGRFLVARSRGAASRAQHLGAQRRAGRPRAHPAQPSELRGRRPSRSSPRDHRRWVRGLSRRRVCGSRRARRQTAADGHGGEHELRGRASREPMDRVAVTAVVTAGVRGQRDLRRRSGGVARNRGRDAKRCRPTPAPSTPCC